MKFNDFPMTRRHNSQWVTAPRCEDCGAEKDISTTGRSNVEGSVGNSTCFACLTLAVGKGPMCRPKPGAIDRLETKQGLRRLSNRYFRIPHSIMRIR